MKNTIAKKLVSLFSILIVGIFFMLGCGGGSYTKPKPSVNYQNLDLAKKAEYDSLLEKREYLKTLEKRTNNEWLKAHEAKEKYKESDPLGIKRKHSNTWVDLMKQEKESWAKLEKIRTESNIIESKIDKIAEESNKSCFPSDIQVLMKDGTHKPISSIIKGDEVVVYDIAKNTISNSTVNEIMISSNNHYYVLNNSIKATAYERFLTQDGWKRIREIQEGDKIFNGNDYISVNHIEKVLVDDEVYNLNINSNHNFFVSYDAQNNMLVHNSGGGGGGGSDGGGK